eukprot:4595803-Pyramimonas_sp.AAC.1
MPRPQSARCCSNPDKSERGGFTLRVASLMLCARMAVAGSYRLASSRHASAPFWSSRLLISICALPFTVMTSEKDIFVVAESPSAPSLCSVSALLMSGSPRCSAASSRFCA